MTKYKVLLMHKIEKRYEIEATTLESAINKLYDFKVKSNNSKYKYEIEKIGADYEYDDVYEEK